MVSLVMPYKHSLWNDTEIKYSLRSIEKHLHNYGELFIIGDKPKGITNYIHIPYPNTHDRVWKEKNIYEKVMVACLDERVSENFLYMNDDHFFNSDYEFGHIPFYYSEWPIKTDMYKQTIDNTRKVLGEDDYILFYDVHFPMIFNKHFFSLYLSGLDWNVKAGYCMKSIYGNCMEGNIMGSNKKYYPDLKIKTIEHPYDFMNMIKNRLWFSTDDQMRDASMESLLKQLFPTKSKWEL